MDDFIFRFIYVTAMQDATLQAAYNGEKKWLWSKSEIEKEGGAVYCVISCLKCFVDRIIKGAYKNQEEYNEAFKCCAKKICDTIKDYDTNPNIENGKPKKDKKGKEDIVFSFGNAQKLINMTVKYFDITTYGNSEIRKNFIFCHCPMDKQMLERVWDDEKWENKDIKNVVTGYQNKTTFIVSWSKLNFGIDESRYNDFQEAVRYLCDKHNNIAPIEYDYKFWGEPKEDNRE